MKLSEWTKTQLPQVVERLHAELVREDPVPQEYAATPVAAAWYHISRHARNLRVTERVGPGSKRTKGSLPRLCGQPASTCKAFGLANALLACQPGAPGMRRAFFNRYADAVRIVQPALLKLLQRLSPPARSMCAGLLRFAPALSPLGRTILAEAIMSHDELLRASSSLKWIDEVGLGEFCDQDTCKRRGKKPQHYHLDQITKPLLGCYFDREIAALVPDGDPPGDGNEKAIARVANRRQKLSGSRMGGRHGRPGRPRKAARSET